MSMQRPGTEAIRIQIQPSKPEQEMTKLTNSSTCRECPRGREESM